MSSQDEVPGAIRWRCRRGMLELDLLLEGFLETGYAGLDEGLREAFRELLERQDPELQRWLLNGEPVELPELQGIVARVRFEVPG